MENLLLSFNIVAPLIVYLLTGAALRKTGIVDEHAFRGANAIVFYATLPLLCMRAIGASDLSEMIKTPFLLYVLFGILLFFALSVLFVPRFCSDDKRRPVLVLGVFRSNDAIFGLGVAAALLGEDNMALMSLAIAMSIPLFNMLSVIVLERYTGGTIAWWRLILRVLKNPVVVGCVAGFIVNLTGLTFPAFLDTPMKGIASLTTPLAFITLGGTMTFAALKKNRLAITLVSLLRLLLIPAVSLAVLLALGFRGAPIVVALILFGAPVAMASYTMAVAARADDELAGSLVAVTSALSIVTMFFFIFVLKQFAFI